MCVSRPLRVLLLLLPLCCAPARAQDTVTLEETSSAIRSRLQDLRTSSALVTAQLTELSEDLRASRSEAEELRERSESLSSSLTAISAKLSDSCETITLYGERLRRRARIIAVLTIVIAVRLLGMILGYVLCFRGVKTPRWLDILL